jgi:hypothetical protein
VLPDFKLATKTVTGILVVEIGMLSRPGPHGGNSTREI